MDFDQQYSDLVDATTKMQLSYDAHIKVIDLISKAYHLGKREAFTEAKEEIGRASKMFDISLKYC